MKTLTISPFSLYIFFYIYWIVHENEAILYFFSLTIARDDLFFIYFSNL